MSQLKREQDEALVAGILDALYVGDDANAAAVRRQGSQDDDGGGGDGGGGGGGGGDIQVDDLELNSVRVMSVLRPLTLPLSAIRRSIVFEASI